MNCQCVVCGDSISEELEGPNYLVDGSIIALRFGLSSRGLCPIFGRSVRLIHHVS